MQGEKLHFIVQFFFDFTFFEYGIVRICLDLHLCSAGLAGECELVTSLPVNSIILLILAAYLYFWPHIV